MILNSAEIKEILPHRYPMLLIDRITELEPLKYAKGYKNVTHNDPFFEGHFPNRPIMPGVLILEAMAQVGGIALMYPEENRGKLAVFGGMDKVKFRKQVVPGDQLIMHAEIMRIKGTMGKILCRSFVDDQLAAEGEFMFALV